MWRPSKYSGGLRTSFPFYRDLFFLNEFSDVVIWMDTFHIALNFLAIIGKKYLNSSLEDLLVESEVYTAGSKQV